MQSLPHESLLQLLVEVSVAFVGFSMLASVLRPNVQTERTRLLGFRDVAETSLIAALGSLAPLVLAAFGLSQDLIWRIVGGAVGSIWLMGTVGSRRRQDMSTVQKLSPSSAFFLPATAAVVILVALMNVLFPSGARHVLLVALCLTVSGWLFLFSAFSLERGSKEMPNEESDSA